MGMRHSRFLEWAPDDQAKAVARLIWERREQSETCMQCGTKPSAWRDPQTGWTMNPPPFVAQWENCEGCNTIEREEKAHEKEQKDKGMRVRLAPNEQGASLDVPALKRG